MKIEIPGYGPVEVAPLGLSEMACEFIDLRETEDGLTGRMIRVMRACVMECLATGGLGPDEIEKVCARIPLSNSKVAELVVAAMMGVDLAAAEAARADEAPEVP